MSEIKVGYCRCCGNPRNVEVTGGENQKDNQEEFNILATENCDCYAATKLRKERTQREECEKNIDRILGEKYPEIADVFRNNIVLIQGNVIKKITINTHNNQTARMSSTKDGIKVELEKKQKTDALA